MVETETIAAGIYVVDHQARNLSIACHTIIRVGLEDIVVWLDTIDIEHQAIDRPVRRKPAPGNAQPIATEHIALTRNAENLGIRNVLIQPHGDGLSLTDVSHLIHRCDAEPPQTIVGVRSRKTRCSGQDSLRQLWRFE